VVALNTLELVLAYLGDVAHAPLGVGQLRIGRIVVLIRRIVAVLPGALPVARVGLLRVGLVHGAHGLLLLARLLLGTALHFSLLLADRRPKS